MLASVANIKWHVLLIGNPQFPATFGGSLSAFPDIINSVENLLLYCHHLLKFYSKTV